MMLACTFVIQAQQQTEDILYLKNGSVLRGEIISLPDQPTQVKIKSSGNIWVFDISEVDKIEHKQEVEAREEIQHISSSSTSFDSFMQRQEKGYYNITDFGLLCGKDGMNYNVYSFSFQIVNGYQINDTWATGIGIGAEGMDKGFIPIFAEGRYHMWDEDFSPFAALQVGYGFPMAKQAEGGLLINPLIGFRNYFNASNGISFGIGYRFQKYIYEGPANDPSYGFYDLVDEKKTTYFHRFCIRFGFLFN